MTMYEFNPASVLRVLVPKVHTSAVPKSGIVAIFARRFWQVYFEGNLYGAENLGTIEERLLHAAGRLLTRYPTASRELVLQEDFDNRYLTVGEYVAASHELTIHPEHREVWNNWVEQGVMP